VTDKSSFRFLSRPRPRHSELIDDEDEDEKDLHVAWSEAQPRLPYNSNKLRCHGARSVVLRLSSAATASSAPRGAMKEGSSPCSSATASRRRRNTSAALSVCGVRRVPTRRRRTGQADSGRCNAFS